ncbi:MAG: ferrous iron transport protein A [Candidatus Obscuribacterales bacterium]|jgi:ferrous iron transport protein A|nr:ferrous iron transport protein A [Candidatus Obscuribacterales bacterium]
MTLADAKDGAVLIVVETGDDEISLQALRFGIDCGAEIEVQKNIRGGPVIVARNQMEIAIGREIAKNIEVRIKGNE